ncbi:MAG TPA: cytochrome c [Hyphomicrobiaceae bacterium]|nr:cytochrome c [Hyphomicrobiaceae bacterium]HLB07679.1 cytochrome c [Alphaproteobacteria bacterium]
MGATEHSATAGRRMLFAAIWTLSASLCANSGALAQVGPDASKGRALADKLCTSCHIVGKEAPSTTVPADVPSFAAIASRPGQTAEAIADRFVMPHLSMPQIQLTRSEVADLAAYIHSLKKP